MRSLRALFATGLALALAAPASATIINLTASLDCAQANAGAGTCTGGGSGTGSATVTFDTVSNLLSWNLSYSGLSAGVTAAHFHGPATTSQNAGITVGIGTANPAAGSATLTAGQAADLLDELWYINDHTSIFTGGEIRGQVLLAPEPGVLGLLAAGLLGLWWNGRRRS
jgi:hypothetical protein